MIRHVTFGYLISMMSSCYYYEENTGRFTDSVIPEVSTNYKGLIFQGT